MTGARQISIIVASGRGVAERWRRQYYNESETPRWMKTTHGDTQIIYDKLCDLGENPTIENVAAVIGNKSWSYLSCSACNDAVVRAAAFSNDILICRTCLREGILALDRKE